MKLTGAYPWVPKRAPAAALEWKLRVTEARLELALDAAHTAGEALAYMWDYTTEDPMPPDVDMTRWREDLLARCEL